MNYDDLWLLKQIKKLTEQVSLIASRIGNVENIVSGTTQIYEVYSDPTTSGFLPDDVTKPAQALYYDSITFAPIDEFWWNVSQQIWK